MKRTVRVGLTTYQAADGRYRLAQTGDVVDVHPDFVDRFDRYNVLAGETVDEVDEPVTELEPVVEPEPVEEKPAPKRGGPRARS
ncbi:hypothetical protein [Nocardia asteroides]|uniref:hypothetical protein n=1 Tax=Nocardia asteroides TaxID=1824 RepID=UPI0033E12F90